MVKRGEIYWVDFTQVPGKPVRKKRPALVVQNDAGNKFSPYVIVAAIHAETKKGLPVHVSLSKGIAGLTKSSVVDCGVLSTLPMAMLGGRLGRLSGEGMLRVDRALKISLNLR